MLSIKEKLYGLRGSLPAGDMKSQELHAEKRVYALEEHGWVIREKRFAADFLYGSFFPTMMSEVSPRTLALVAGDRAFLDVFPQNLLLIDTETTGLAGGTGTYAFLIGTAFLEEGELVVRQFLMSDFDYELETLTAFVETLRQKKITSLVSYNGKSFDLPLLKNRFVLNRLSTRDLEEIAHIDLLKTVRRLWKKKLPSCTLSDVEYQLLHVQRNNDIPGSEIPKTFFRFLQTRDFQTILPILKHNVQDLLSMACLLIEIDRLFSEPGRQGSADRVWMYRMLNEAGFQDDAASLCENAVHTFQSSTIRVNPELFFTYAMTLKRAKRFREAAAVLCELLPVTGWSLRAGEELAKYYEHVEKDFEKALSVLRRCEQIVEVESALGKARFPSGVKEEWQVRTARLLRKRNQKPF